MAKNHTISTLEFRPHPICKNFNDLTGRTFNSLTVLGYAGSDFRYDGRWHCQCECGKITTVKTGALTGLSIKTCGCHPGNLKHGHTKHNAPSTPEYSSWENMNQRCYNPNVKRYDRYGGRGVEVCARWRGKLGFENFLTDMGPRPSLKHSIDRHPNKNGNYEPQNSRWATQAEQNRNRAGNHNITFEGETMCITDWASRIGISVRALGMRIKNWGIERALTTPVFLNYRR